jgi:amino-acid N-acetyltransferase
VRAGAGLASGEETECRMSTALHVTSRPSLGSAVALLKEAQLPTEDLTPAHVEHFFFVGPAQAPTGLVGLELFGDVALLRSLVVAREHRGKGDGAALVDHAERYARAHGVRAIYLLTTTADSFFSKLGYRSAAREAAPAAIRATREFAGICPASSAFMTRQL